MRVAIIGGTTGMLGKSLMATCPKDVDIVWKAGRLGAGIDSGEYRDALLNTDPDLVINTAAVHDVNKIEADPETAGRAWDINAAAVGELAKECARDNVRFMHVSTDYVFNSETIVTELTQPSPVNTYGITKLAGERFIQGTPCDYMIIRTGALFGPGKNFVDLMLVKSQEDGEIRVVRDQRTAPTYTKHLAIGMWYFVDPKNWFNKKVYHLMASGSVSWFSFAQTILTPLEVDVLETTSYHMGGAPRPEFSVLRSEWDDICISLPPWRYGLVEYLRDKESGFWNQD